MNLSSTLIVTNKQKKSWKPEIFEACDCVLAREHYIGAKHLCSHGVVQFKWS